MEYRKLGRAGVKVSKLCFGAGIRGTLPEQQFVRNIHQAIDLGCNFIDCADGYGRGHSETWLGRAIQGKRDGLVITSKVCSPVGSGPNQGGLSRYHIMDQVEHSLRALGTDRIDIYYLHNVDPDTAPEETLRTLEDLVRQGKVRYLGVSNHSPVQIVELLWAADRLGLEPIYCLQQRYNLLDRRQVEPEILSLCRRYGLALMTYSPMAVGLLSGRFRRGQPPPESFWDPNDLKAALTERTDQVIARLVELSHARGATPAQMAIAWILDHKEVTAPIVGADRREYIAEVFGALEIELTPEERQALDEVSSLLG